MSKSGGARVKPSKWNPGETVQETSVNAPVERAACQCPGGTINCGDWPASTSGPSSASVAGPSVRAAREDGFAVEGDQIVVIAGVPFQVAGSTNILRVATCDESLINRTDPE